MLQFVLTELGLAVLAVSVSPLSLELRKLINGIIEGFFPQKIGDQN